MYNSIYLSSPPFSGSCWLLDSEPLPPRMNDSPCPSLSSLTLFSYVEVTVSRAVERNFSFAQRFPCCSQQGTGLCRQGYVTVGMELVLPAAGLLLRLSTSGPRAHKIIASRPGTRLGVCQVISHLFFWFLSQALPPGALLCSEMRQPLCGRCVFLGSLQHFN